MLFQDIVTIDYVVHSWFNSVRTDALTDFFETVTEGGSWQFILVCVALIAVVFYVRGYQQFIAPLVTTLVVGEAITFALKIVVARPRALDALVLENDFSFPSGHTMFAVALYGFLIYVARQLIRSRWKKHVATGLGVLTIILIAVSRLYLGVHYLSDVVVGFGIGLAALLFSIYLHKRNLFKLR